MSVIPSETRELFVIMQNADREMYAAGDKARKARKDWETACKLRVMKTHPEIQGLVNEIQDLKLKLSQAQSHLQIITDRNDVTHMFREYMP